uniref:Uncharacterized protein n=1 Tax=Timema genevievae TaxID=629358 RepID=A0A7R9K591_TIMGE|nr:unnamed protein product [Timema genevievae]
MLGYRGMVGTCAPGDPLGTSSATENTRRFSVSNLLELEELTPEGRTQDLADRSEGPKYLSPANQTISDDLTSCTILTSVEHIPIFSGSIEDDSEDFPGSFEAELAYMDQLEAESNNTDSQGLLGEGPESQETSVKWSRPTPPPLDPQRDPITFQQIDMDHYTVVLSSTTEDGKIEVRISVGYSSPMASLVLTDSSQLTSDSQLLEEDYGLQTVCCYRGGLWSADCVLLQRRTMVCRLCVVIEDYGQQTVCCYRGGLWSADCVLL